VRNRGARRSCRPRAERGPLPSHAAKSSALLSSTGSPGRMGQTWVEQPASRARPSRSSEFVSGTSPGRRSAAAGRSSSALGRIVTRAGRRTDTVCTPTGAATARSVGRRRRPGTNTNSPAATFSPTHLTWHPADVSDSISTSPSTKRMCSRITTGSRLGGERIAGVDRVEFYRRQTSDAPGRGPPRVRRPNRYPVHRCGREPGRRSQRPQRLGQYRAECFGDRHLHDGKPRLSSRLSIRGQPRVDCSRRRQLALRWALLEGFSCDR
jgi:hypothetical protein